MDEVNVVSLAVGQCVDACCLLLDLVVGALSWLLRFLSGVGVILSGSTLVEYWNFAVFSFLAATEAVSGAAHGALRALEVWLQPLGGVFESFKMVGHLFCHVAWRTKDVLHRGFMSGCSILRLTCEGVLIALSLVLYFVNTVVNIVLIGTQNCLSALASVWETVADPVHRVAELALTLLTFLYSCLVGASVLLWTPCQLLLDFLGALGHVLFTVFMVDSHGLLVTASVVSVALLALNPRLPVLAGRLCVRLVQALLGARGIQTTVRRLCALVLELGLVQQAVLTRTQRDMSRTRLPSTDTGDLIAEGDLLPVSQPERPGAQRDGEAASGGGTNPSADDGELLSLLKEQEERKKCVICQDLSKTVLLLPCRHLCLCRRCADILTQRRPAQHRCCPLCRRHITQTMDVFL